MKKDLIFAPIMLIIGIVLFLFKLTGAPAHIAVSVVGIAVLAAYTVFTKKDWKLPALEIGMRASYGIALITGIVLMNLADNAALAIVHRVFAIVFCVALVAVVAHKVITEKIKK